MKKKIIFREILVEFIEQRNVCKLAIKSNIGDWLNDMEVDSRFLHYISLDIYGVPAILDDDLEEAYYAEDTSKFSKIGQLMGYYIPFEEILEAGEDPIDVCDAASVDLEFAASIMQYYYENEAIALPPSLFYIDELEIDEQYRGNGFGSKVLQELPSLLNYYKGIRIDYITYYPIPTHRDELPAFQDNENKIIVLPRDYNQGEMNDRLEDEGNNLSYPKEYKNIELFDFYERNGFKEFEETRILIKELS